MTLYMPLFRSCATLRSLTQLHAHLFVSGLHGDPQASTKLIESYAQMGVLQSSRLVFETFSEPDSFMWGVLIKTHVWNQCFQEAISLYDGMILNQSQISSYIFPSVLRACSGFRDLSNGSRVHGRIIKSGFEHDAVIETSLLSMYGELDFLDDARKIFDEMPIRDMVSWSSIISSYVERGEVIEGLDVFRLMVSENVELDHVTMLSVAEACAELGILRQARSVHGHIVRRKIEIDGLVDSSLIVMYSKCGDFSSAKKIFLRVSNRSVTLRTAMISSCNRSGCFEEALELFAEMLESKVQPNFVTLMSVLGSCAGLGRLKEGKSIHGYMIRNCVNSGYDFLGPALIDFYAQCGKLTNSKKVLYATGQRNIVAWNMLISSYVQSGFLKEALLLLVGMLAQGLMPDSFSLASSLSACGDGGLLQPGLLIHSHITKRGFWNEFVQNALIDMYSKCGSVNLAYLIFENIQHKSVVAWNSMICGFSQNGNSLEAICFFDQMYLNCLEMNEVSFLSVIQACADSGYLEKGKWLHHKLITYGVRNTIYIDTALTDLYSKCGDLQTARRVFDSMPERSVVSWSVMIAGYGIHGQITSAISLFIKMLEAGATPNDVTFMNILTACSHAGYVLEGKYYFGFMREFGIEPNSEHLACLVDLLSRAGDLDEAYRIINSMPYPADASIWGALLNGCRIHQRMDMIQIIERELLNISTNDTGYYTLLSNIYAEGGNWSEFRRVRSVMKSTGLKKVPGYSTIELDKRIYWFGAGDSSYLLANEIYFFLECFSSLAGEEFYNVKSDVSVSNACNSEEPVIAYGLINANARTEEKNSSKPYFS
ncbi:putative Pentatricopeptide repeat-containing protein [Tripterygium wilfordii]|uniref:Putative Pentatricopeptide repeat-containing protein n=1 Tax=Tripterygium wilfordii TaxID=458696 RepID=A0A7J7DGH4_TRIWF|nr:putative pentatricopeptide repeat-containing protein At1g69350, mitochondrial [Tripterygium wilfordii]KAF5745441.1 putative Pentatricopeptide repeat-containing protein [Tripterygium wilfordii]